MGFIYIDKWLRVIGSQDLSAKTCLQRRLCRYGRFSSFIIFYVMFVLNVFGETHKRMNFQSHFYVLTDIFLPELYSIMNMWPCLVLVFFWLLRHIPDYYSYQNNWFAFYKRFSYALTIATTKACNVSFIKLLFRKESQPCLTSYQPCTIIFRWLFAQYFFSAWWLL